MELTLRIPSTDEEIKEEIAWFRQQIKERDAEIKMFKQGIEHYQQQCVHPQDQVIKDVGEWTCQICGLDVD